MCSCGDRPKDHSNLNVTVRTRLTTRVSVNGSTVSVGCWWGQSVSGPKDIVEEAHRQHLLRHEEQAK